MLEAKARLHELSAEEILGDILIKGKKAYLFCEEEIADYIITNLDKVRHTSVRVSRISQDVPELQKELQDMENIFLSKVEIRHARAGFICICKNMYS